MSCAEDYLPTIAGLLERATGPWDLVLYNAGMDPHQGSDIGGLRGVTTEMLAERERIVFAWARRRGVPVAFVLAGGYSGARLSREALAGLHRLTIAAASPCQMAANRPSPSQHDRRRSFMNIQTDRALLPAGKTAVRYLTVTITAPERARRHERPAVHAALVLDRSGSMAGRKIEMAKKAVDHAVRLLNERDRLAVVCYDTEIDTLLGATAATAEAKKLALTRLKAIDARGGTDLCGGWLRGAEELTPVAASAESSQAEADTALRRVLLLSDGQANQGETNPDVLARHAADLRAKGIATSTFGVGADFDEVLMSRLATEGGGHFYFIEHPAQIPDFLTSELGEALEVVARDARLVIAGGPGVEIGCLNEFPVETHAGRSRNRACTCASAIWSPRRR